MPFQDGVFAGGPMLCAPSMHCAPSTVRAVDVSMETLASAWVHDDAPSYQDQGEVINIIKVIQIRVYTV